MKTTVNHNLKKFKPILRLYGLFLTGNSLSFAIKIIGSFILTKFTVPEMLGQFNSQGLIISYSIFVLLGVQDGFAREFPYLIGKQKVEEAKELASSAQTWSFFWGVLLSIILFIFGLVNILLKNFEIGSAWFSYAINAFVLFYGLNYLQVTYRTSGEFEKIAFTDVITNIIMLFSTFLIYFFGFYGLCLRLTFGDITRFYLLYKFRPLKIPQKPNLKKIKELLISGFPIYITSQIYVWWSVLNLTLILIFLGNRDLGLFQLAIIISSAAELVITSITQIIYPKTAELYGKVENIKSIISPIIKSSIFLLIITIAISIIIWFILPNLVEKFLPNYVDGIGSAIWATFSIIPLSVQPIVRLFFIIKKQRSFMICSLFGILAYSLSLLFFNNLQLVQFPIAMLIGRFVFALFVLIFLSLYLLEERRLTHSRNQLEL